MVGVICRVHLAARGAAAAEQQGGTAAAGQEQGAGAAEKEQVQEPRCSRKQQRISVEAGNSAPMTIDEIYPCQVCGISECSDMIVCDWCAASAGHLGCLGFTEVPTDSWFCSSTCGSHREAAVAAAKLHARWVLLENLG